MRLEEYFRTLDMETKKAYEIARKARSLLLDPKPDVEVMLAENLAARVENLVSIAVPALKGSGLKERIMELEEKYTKGDERIGFLIAEEVAKGTFCEFDSKEKAIEAGIRVGTAYWTLGIVTAPLEGFTHAKIKKRMDGGEYLALYFAGPIRSAGGTTNAMIVMLGDFLRKKFGIGKYDATSQEIERYYLEMEDYHKRVARLQYMPSYKEVKFIVENLPVEVTGEATEDFEVLAYKDLPRVETNKIRGGMVLTMSMIALKASKLLKRVKKYGKMFGLENWSWLEKLVEMKEKKKDGENEEGNAVYLSEIPGGRPVFSYPNAVGGFRLRYGRARNTGFATVGIHPATMYLLGKFLAVGTQIKIELPGKAATVAPVHSIEGPIVKLKDGSVVKVRSLEEAKKISKNVDKILFLGDVLIPYGEFLTNGHPLEPSGWVEEWWLKEVKSRWPEFDKRDVDFDEAVEISRKYDVPLHPKYTYFWENLSGEEVKKLQENLGKWNQVKNILEKLGVPHRVEGGKVILDEIDEKVLRFVLSRKIENIPENGIEAVNMSSPVKIMRKVGRYVGARMGRPEKAERRIMRGSPHILFPAGRTERMRNVVEALKTGLRAELAIRICPKCGKRTYYLRCPRCGEKTVQRFVCVKCGRIVGEREHCGLPTKAYLLVKVEDSLEEAAKKVGMKIPELLKGVKGLSSDVKIPERLEKGLLRKKYDLCVNKDGTVRVDLTDMPLTHFKPKEIGVDVETLKKLGYERDAFGNPLENEDQIVELLPQDIIISDSEEFSTAEYLVKVAKFIDELLVKFYGMKPYYNVKRKEDLIGKLVVGLAPHTAAGIVGRIIGFTKARVLFAHPAWHAAKKRNCDGDEDSIILLLDALINFSREFLPSTRGGKTMDVPLVLTTTLDLSEVDDEVHDMDIVGEYPLELYRASLERKFPDAVKIKTMGDLKNEILSGIKYTHETNNVSAGPLVTAYRSLGPMLEKVKKQLKLAEMVLAVNEHDVAEKILVSHFLKDIKGNLRKYSTQEFRCINCNEKYRRPPLIGKCLKCGGKIVLTVHEGTVLKYYEVSAKLAQHYNVSKYVRDQLRVLERKILLNFGTREKQEGLEAWLA